LGQKLLSSGYYGTGNFIFPNHFARNQLIPFRRFIKVLIIENDII